MVTNSKNYKRYYPLLKWIIAIVSVAFFVRKFLNLDKQLFIDRIGLQLQSNWILFIVVIALMLLNWYIESYKFRLLLKKELKLSRVKSFMTVLSGVTVSTFTPARTGDFIGRSLLLKSLNPIKVIIATLAGNITQVLMTYSFGIISFILFLIFDVRIDLVYNIKTPIIIALIMIICIIIFLYFVPSIVLWLKGKVPRIVTKGIRIIRHYNQKVFLKIVGLSMLRYLTFTVQFFLLLTLFSSNALSPEIVILIPFAYVMQSVIPVPAIGDLGVRYYVSNLLFSPYMDSNEILMAISALWFINLLIPALLGTINIVFSLGSNK